MSPEDRALLRHLEKLEGVDSLLDWVPRYQKGYSRPDHLRPLVELFFRAESEPVQATFNAPPRHGKTETILALCVRFLTLYPSKTVVFATYSAGLANEKSKRARALAEKAGLKLRKDSKSQKLWRTEQGGGFIAVGVGGSLTGFGGDLIICDDLVSNRADAESATKRDNTWAWFTSVCLTRLEPGGSIIVSSTRWHQDDVTGRIATEIPTFEKYNLQALAEADGHTVALWPQRWTALALESKRREIGAYDFASLYQGQPVPLSGTLFKDIPLGAVSIPANARYSIGCDPAATASNKADYSVIVVAATWGVGADQHWAIVDVYRAQVEIPALVAKLKTFSDLYRCPVHIECVAGFKGVAQSLRAIVPGLKVIEQTPKGDKLTRALPTSAAWNDGRIHIPSDKPWVAEFYREVTSFTGVKDAHDDCPDALGIAVAATRIAAVVKQPQRGAVVAPLWT